MTLTLTQSRALRSLLAQYQELLENAITCELIPGDDAGEQLDLETRKRVQRDRRRWRACEDFGKLLARDPKAEAERCGWCMGVIAPGTRHTPNGACEDCTVIPETRR